MFLGTVYLSEISIYPISVWFKESLLSELCVWPQEMNNWENSEAEKRYQNDISVI